jgi:stage II sporulation protein M
VLNKIKKAAAYHIQENISVYTFTVILFFIGIIFGAIIVNSLSIDQKQDLYLYLSRFFGQVAEGNFAYTGDMFNQSFTHYIKYLGLMWLLGLSIIGLPIILIMLFLKGIVIGFTVGFLVNQMHWQGFVLSFVSVLPQNLLLVPAFIIIGTASIVFSLRMIRQQFRKTDPILPYFVRYTLLMVFTALFLTVSSSFEAYLSPGLMKSIVQWIY